MSSLTEPSSIVLLIGAFFILIFILHGLWFSNKPQNRKLKKNDLQDQELRKSQNVAKVRIVRPDLPSDVEEDDDGITINRYSRNASNSSRRGATLSISDLEEGIEEIQPAASIHVNKSRSHITDNDLGIEELDLNDMNRMNNGSIQSFNSSFNQGIDQININNVDASINQADNSDSTNYYDLVIVAPEDRPYRGEDIQEICNSYGFIQGFMSDNFKVFSVYENVSQKTNEVFRICSLKPPYYFPDDMTGYKTSGLVLYMTLPAPGRAYSYFNALRMATKIFIDKLGGHLEDNAHNIIDEARLEQLAKSMQEYDSKQNQN